MSGVLKKIIHASTLRSLVASGAINKEGVRLFDCTFLIEPRADWRQFKEQHYGKFDELLAVPSKSYNTYASVHIPGAVHANLDVATYPSKYERATYYPAEIFERFVQLLGVHKDEHIICYGRGAQGGMLFSGRMAWMLKSYGQEKLSLLDGGLAQYHKEGGPLSKDPVKLEKGNWTAVDRLSDLNASFEEVVDAKDADGKTLIESGRARVLDTRIRVQFDGTEDTGLDPLVCPATHIPGTINVPSAELLTPDGVLKGTDEIKKMYPSTPGPVVTLCNSGMQASFLAYVLDAVDEGAKTRVYPGSLKEVEKRAPSRISGGISHLPPPPKQEKKASQEKNYDNLVGVQ